MNNEDKKKIELFNRQKKLLDTFLSTGAISQAQYDKSYGDLRIKMGIDEIMCSASDETVI